MIRIREAIIVEGRYDKNTLAQIVDAPILETSGFGIFHDSQRLALLQGHQQHREQHAADGHCQGRADIEEETQGYPEQCGVGQGIAEIGHPPPDHEGTQGAGHQGQGEAGEEGVEQEVSHGCSRGRACGQE